MDSNLYTQILDEQYENWKTNHLVMDQTNLTAKFKRDAELIPYLQQFKMYDC